jgi:plastocyanin
MSRRLLPALAITAVLSLAACAGGSTPATGVASSPVPAASAPAASADSGAGACASSTAAGTVQASMAGRAFSPTTIQAKVGDVITWTNNDTLPHTATLTDDPTCTTENLGAGASGSLTFSAAGSYAFFCKVHSDMTGTIEVTG